MLLRDSRFDPVADLPVRELVANPSWPTEAASSGARSTGPCPVNGSGPYVHQRYDDLSPVGSE